jgi:hypothetical protein
MKLIALIDDDEVIEKILRHLDLWPEQTEPRCPGKANPYWRMGIPLGAMSAQYRSRWNG